LHEPITLDTHGLCLVRARALTSFSNCITLAVNSSQPLHATLPQGGVHNCSADVGATGKIVNFGGSLTGVISGFISTSLPADDLLDTPAQGHGLVHNAIGKQTFLTCHLDWLGLRRRDRVQTRTFRL
jgi:hypothetical protein